MRSGALNENRYTFLLYRQTAGVINFDDIGYAPNNDCQNRILDTK
jgi:hypothetical protein